jgi:hypothetical protein
MTAMNMAKHRNNPNFAFWKMLKEGYDHFSATHQEPKVAVCEKRYVFDAAPPDDSTKPLSFNPKGACPAYQIDKTIADAVHEERRQEQLKMAQYIASGVATVPSRAGADGGMNPVFLAKLSPSSNSDNNGRIFELTGTTPVSASTVPGALPRTPNRGNVTLAKLQTPEPSEPAVLAKVPLPHPAPQPKQGEASPEQSKPTLIAGLIGNLFGGSKAEAMPHLPASEKQATALRGANTELVVKPNRATQVRTTSAPAHTASAPLHTASAAVAPSPKPGDTAPKTVAPNISTPASTPPMQQAAWTEAPRTRESETPASDNGLLSGAQPVVPVGSFSSFR